MNSFPLTEHLSCFGSAIRRHGPQATDQSLYPQPVRGKENERGAGWNADKKVKGHSVNGSAKNIKYMINHTFPY